MGAVLQSLRIRSSQLSRIIIGPVASDLQALGDKPEQVALATAFYSRGLLKQIELKTRRLRLFVRLDLLSTDDWVRGVVAPDALLELVKRHEARGVSVRVFINEMAHAKLYIGDRSCLLGSANLTLRGFSGLGHELLWLEDSPMEVAKIWRSVNAYSKVFQEIQLHQLARYVDQNAAQVSESAKEMRSVASNEDCLPNISKPRPARIGTYEDFLVWLVRQKEPAAKEVLDRAEGKSQLSGHINRNFHGLRQFFLTHSDLIKVASAINPNTYKLSQDKVATTYLKNFVLTEAANEGSFVLDVWKTYLPESCGGKPKSGGGTSGNLNRMLPLVAIFLLGRLSGRR